MKRFWYWVFNILLIMGTLVTAMGLLYYQVPEAFDWFFDFLNIGEAGRTYFTMTVGGTTIAGIGTKFLRTVVNTDNLKRDALHELAMKKLSEKHDKEIELLKSDNDKTIQVITETANEQINATNSLILQQDLILKERIINAKRVLEMSPTLVSDEIKQEYRDFLVEVGELEVELVDNFYVENKEIITIVEEPKVEEEVHIPLSQRLAKDKEV